MSWVPDVSPPARGSKTFLTFLTFLKPKSPTPQKRKLRWPSDLHRVVTMGSHNARYEAVVSTESEQLINLTLTSPPLPAQRRAQARRQKQEPVLQQRRALQRFWVRQRARLRVPSGPG